MAVSVRDIREPRSVKNTALRDVVYTHSLTSQSELRDNQTLLIILGLHIRIQFSDLKSFLKRVKNTEDILCAHQVHVNNGNVTWCFFSAGEPPAVLRLPHVMKRVTLSVTFSLLFTRTTLHVTWYRLFSTQTVSALFRGCDVKHRYITRTHFKPRS